MHTEYLMSLLPTEGFEEKIRCSAAFRLNKLIEWVWQKQQINQRRVYLYSGVSSLLKLWSVQWKSGKVSDNRSASTDVFNFSQILITQYPASKDVCIKYEKRKFSYRDQSHWKTMKMERKKRKSWKRGSWEQSPFPKRGFALQKNIEMENWSEQNH